MAKHQDDTTIRLPGLVVGAILGIVLLLVLYIGAVYLLKLIYVP